MCDTDMVFTVLNADQETVEVKVGDMWVMMCWPRSSGDANVFDSVLLLPAKDPETPSQIIRRRPVASTPPNWEDLTYAHVTVDTSGEVSLLAPSNTSQVPVDLLESDDEVDQYQYTCGGEAVQAGYDEVWHGELAAIRRNDAGQVGVCQQTMCVSLIDRRRSCM